MKVLFVLFFSLLFLSKSAQSRNIYIFGEIHQSLSSKDQTCYQRSLKLINMAKEGKIILGLEGLTPSDTFRLKAYNSSLPKSIKVTKSDLSKKESISWKELEKTTSD